MGNGDFIDKAKRTVRDIVPKGINLTSIEFEGPVVVIYTKNLEAFASNNDIVRKLAQGLRRRVAIRPDPSILEETDRAETEIKHIVPAEAEITDIWFDTLVGEVTIEAMSPGVAIGPKGKILNEIKKKIGWAPKVVRTPPIPSKTVGEIRGYLKMVSDERKAWLKKVGKKINREKLPGETYARISSLGGFREVGRSASLLSTKNSKVLIDCGVKFASGEDDTPYLSAPEVLPIDSIDAIIITHAHLDHSGLLPVLYKYGYDGPVYCTAPTRDMMSLLQLDYIKVAFGEGKKSPYESAHIREVVKHTIPLGYGSTTDIAPDLRLTLHNAGHILGSAVCHFHIGDGLHNIAVTGDIKYEKTWLFNPCSDKFPRLETLVVESTYGGHGDYQPSRREAANEMKEVLRMVLKRGGKVLIPVFAVGRSQEVMMVIQQLTKNKDIPEVPVWLDGMIWEATAIHTAYPEFLNSHLRNQIFQRGENPFLAEIFKRVETSKNREEIMQNPDPCIVLATAGMLNGGPVMEYFREWCTEEKNCLVFVGFQAEGTLGRRIQRGWKEIQFARDGKTIALPINMGVETVDGFSGHSDRRQLMNYVHNLHPRPEKVIIGHGEEKKCLDFASSIYKKFNIESRVPYNLETIRIK
jgi:KH/beta-lactamase-domain protein